MQERSTISHHLLAHGFDGARGLGVLLVKLFDLVAHGFLFFFHFGLHLFLEPVHLRLELALVGVVLGHLQN
jgi:hypothetical protein